MLVKRSKSWVETPFAQTRVSKTTLWSDESMPTEELAGSLHRIKITISDLHSSLNDVPVVLPLDVRDEVVRSCGGGSGGGTNPFPNAAKVRIRQRCRWFIGRFEQPSF